MQTGMTLKQFARHQFWQALKEYQVALATGQNVVTASLRVHIALGGNGIPKSYKRHVNRVYRETRNELTAATA